MKYDFLNIEILRLFITKVIAAAAAIIDAVNARAQTVLTQTNPFPAMDLLFIS